jgi:hypothetical protein
MIKQRSENAQEFELNNPFTRENQTQENLDGLKLNLAK